MEESRIVAARPARVSIERETLKAALELICRVVERRNTIPILSNVVLTAGPDGGLSLMATDLDSAITLDVDAMSEAPGRWTVDAAAMLDAVKKCPKGSIVALTRLDGKMTLQAGRVCYSLQSLPADDMPLIDAGGWDEPPVAFDLNAPALIADMLALAPAICRDESRYYLGGVLFERSGDALNLVATDGANAIVIERDAPGGSDALGGAIVPRKACDLVRRAFTATAGLVAAAFTDRQARFAAPGVTLVCKLVDGSFPAWRDAFAAACGDGPRVELTPIVAALEPSVPVAAIARLEGGLPKGCETVATLADRCVILTCEARPHWTGYATFQKDGAEPRKGFRVNGRDGASEAALRYGLALGEAAGLDVRTSYTFTDHEGAVKTCEGAHVIRSGALFVGVEIGDSIRHPAQSVERVCWERLMTVTDTTDAWTEYLEGAACIVLPRHAQSDVNVELDGATYPLATNAKGEIALTADQVAAIVGPVEPDAHVAIPRFTFDRGAVIAINGIATDGTGRIVAPVAKVKRNDRAALAAYCADPRGTVAALQPRYLDVPDDSAELEPDGGPVEAQEAAPVAERDFSPPIAEIAPQAAIPPAAEPVEAQPVEPVASEPDNGLAGRVAALEALVASLMGDHVASAGKAIPEPVAVEPVARAKDPARLRMIRRYLAMRAARRDLEAALEAQEARHVLKQEADALHSQAQADTIGNLVARCERLELERDDAVKARETYRAEAERADRQQRETSDALALATDRLRAARAEAAAAMELATEAEARGERLAAQVATLAASPPALRAGRAAKFEIVN